MLQKIGGVCVFFSLFAAILAPVRADDDLTPFEQTDHFVVVGVVQSVNGPSERMVMTGNGDHRYVVDAYGADITLLNSRAGETANLARGMRVRVVGTLLGRNLLEADRLRVLPGFAGAGPVDFPVQADISAPVDVSVPAEPSAPVLPLPVPIVATAPAPQIILDGLVRDVDTARSRITLLGDDDKRYTADTHDTDIILRGTERAGSTSDLTRGMHVHLIGIPQPGGGIEADRIRILPAAEVPVPAAVPVPVAENMDAYTGILIDARSLPNISRSPAPAIYSAAPNAALVYPDRSHVPTPDEVQDESIVRYYWTVDAASSGIAGSNPLILTAQAVLGPAQDAVELTPEDAARFQLLDKRLHFTRTWKVGFLMPADH